MALYVPPSKRRTRTLVFAIIALLVGLLIGVLCGRLTAPTIESQVAVVATEARGISAGLRVLALHDQAGTSTNSGDGGAALVIDETRNKLDAIFLEAPWVTAAEQTALIDEVNALAAIPDRSGSEFGQAADALANHIDRVLGG